MFRIFVFAALLAGGAAGLVLSAIQQWQLTPLILAAEKFETAEPAAHSHDQVHEHEAGSWRPADGAERIFFTLLSNMLAGIGFALLTVAGMGLRHHHGWQKGVLWGLAGYLVFFVAPTLGLHPKLPGTTGAPLFEQQLWWITTVAATAAGLALLAFSHSWLLRAMAVVLLIMPHVFGAPLPELADSQVPQSLSDDFILAATFSNALFWLSLGGVSGLLLQRFMPPSLPQADTPARS